MNERVVSLLQEIEAFGNTNDARVTYRSQKMLNITPQTGEFLSILVRLQPAKHVLEIGTSNGYSTLWVVDAVSSTDGTVETVEKNPEKARLARINFERSGLSRFIHLVEADAAEVLAAAADSIYDFVFLDSERTANRPEPELFLQPAEAGGEEDGDDGHAVHDLAGQDHLEHLTKGEGTDLDEFGRIADRLHFDEILRQEQVGRLVHDALARVEGADGDQAAGPIAGFLRQFPLGRLFARLPGMDPSRRHLPGHPPRHVPVLPDQEHRIGIDKGEDPDALAAGDDPVDGGPFVGQFDEVFPQGDPLIAVDGPCREGLPGCFRRPGHVVRSMKNRRV